MDNFQAEMARTGYGSPGIKADGQIHRFHVEGDKPGSKNGWYIVFTDGNPTIVYGSWKTGETLKWCAKSETTLTHQERKAQRLRVEEAKAARDKQLNDAHDKAAEEARKIWAAAKEITDAAEHSYFLEKGVQPYGVRKVGDKIIAPLYDSTGELRSLQYISPDGEKRFLRDGEVSNNYYAIGKPNGKVYIAEGFGSGATVHEASGHAVAVAFNAGNLSAVANAMRQKFPAIEIIICADNDQWNEKNTGIEKAIEAALSTGSKVTIPKFKNTSTKPTDFNDLHQLEGLEVVRQALEVFEDIEDDFPLPIPFDSGTVPELPDGLFTPAIDNMAKAVSQATETPLELAFMLILAVLAACCQRRFVVSPTPGYIENLSLWCIAALESGNRKTAVLSALIKCLLDWESEQAEKLKEEIRIKTAAVKNIDARISVTRSRYAKAPAQESEKLEKEILSLEKSLPEIPKPPRIMVQDITPEKIPLVLAENGGSVGMFSDEGGVVDTITGGRYNNGISNLDVLLQAQAGATIGIERVGRPAVYIRNTALTIGMSPQPSVIRDLSRKPELRNRGFVARILFMMPQSKLGHRTLEANPVQSSVKAEYESAIKALLDIEPNETNGDNGQRYEINFTEEASKEWKDFSKGVEVELREGGRFEHIKDWAGKLPGAAARIAGVMHCAKYAHSQPQTKKIELSTMNDALTLAAILSEHALKAFGMMGADPDIDAARKVWRWIERTRSIEFTARSCLQALKGSFKRMTELEPAFLVLIERHYIFELEPEHTRKPGRPSRIFKVNPALTKEWS